jgi:hypothetical protein
VIVKVLILSLFAAVGLFYVRADHLVFVYLYRTDLRSLAWIVTFYLSVIAAEFSFSKRRLFFK